MTDIQKKRAIKTFWILFAIPFIFIIVLFTMIATGSMNFLPDNLGYMPDFKELENPKSNLASEVFSADQELLGKYYFNENRTIVEFENLPTHLVNALVATEDIRYYDHAGIDGWSLMRVIFKTIILGDSGSGGGSTITQQLAKNLFPRDTKNRSAIGRKMVLAYTKFKEWVIAVKLERNYTKEEILAMYFNTVPFGSMTYGIKAASRTFFGCNPDSLDMAQAALLVGVVNAPTLYSPVRNPENSINRRNNVVFYQMKKYGYITEQQYDSLIKLPLKLNYKVQSHTQGVGTYFREYLKQVLTANEPKRENYGSNAYELFKEDSTQWADNELYGWCHKTKKPNGDTYNLYNDGLKIYTTINSRMQEYAEEATREHMGGYLQPLFFKQKKGKSKAPFDWKVTDKQIGKIYYMAMIRSERYRVLREAKYDSAAIVKNFRTPTHMRVFSWAGDIDTVMTPMDSIRYYKFFLHAGLMSMEPQTGYVRAYVGDIDYYHFKYDNVMLARRQVGSTFKPIIYTMAMMPGGYSPCHKIPNVPVSFPMPNGEPEYTPRFSSSESLNGKMITLQRGLASSLNQVSAWILKQYSPAMAIDLAKKMGIQSYIPEVYSICVGAAEVKLSEMVGAYGTFVNQGVYVEPIFVTRIEDKNGNILKTFKPKKREVISEGTAYRMIHMMKGVVEMGTSTRIWREYKLTNEIAGKTGTTNDNSDGWFIGCVPNLVTGIWVGGEERSIRFGSSYYGQGSSMALPIWALFMQRVYRDKTLEISQDRFPRPESMDGIEIDCSKYKEEDNTIETYENLEEDIY